MYRSKTFYDACIAEKLKKDTYERADEIFLWKSTSICKIQKEKKQSCTLKQFYKQESITSCIGCQFLWKSFAKVDYDEHRRSEHNLQKESEGSCQSG